MVLIGEVSIKMKRVNFNINFSNRLIYSFMAFGIFVLLAVGVVAFGTSNPNTFGHSAGELDLSGGVNGNAIFNGSVGIGTNNPQVKLDVNGEIKISNSGLACNSNVDGSLKYNSIDKAMEYCDGTSWVSLGASCTPGSQNFIIPGEYTFSPPGGCTIFSVEVNGAGSNGAIGGKVTFDYIIPKEGDFRLLVGERYGQSGIGGGGSVGGDYRVGAGASAIAFDGKTLAVAGGAGELSGAGHPGGVGGGGNNECGGDGQGNAGLGGCNNIGGGGCGGSGGSNMVGGTGINYPEFLVSSGAGDQTTLGGGGYGGGGSGGCGGVHGSAGGGGGYASNIINNIGGGAGQGAPVNTNGSIIISYS